MAQRFFVPWGGPDRALWTAQSFALHAASKATLPSYARQKSKFFLDSVCASHVTNMIEEKTYCVTACEPD